MQERAWVGRKSARGLAAVTQTGVACESARLARMSLLTARQITISSEARRRGRRPLLAGLDLHVEPRQVWLLCGAHGSGKSRLLATLAGVAQPSSGAVQVLGEPTGSRRAAQALGWAPESLRWPDTSRVADALAEIATLHSTAALTERVSRVLQQTGLAGVARRRIGELSAGHVRLLSLAQALLDDPPLILIDGQLDSLDAELRTSLLAELGARCAEGAALIIATHAPERLSALATHEMRLLDGEAHTRVLRAESPVAPDSAEFPA
ncbi:MAG: hypothetical protein DHS20C15_11210 [Planctomycetota bacterium]|nr:MAG: hypothetical protein DHS20C15_11210 [Planctomycetota bacterium]